jgi:hypothetical protein
MLLNIKKELYVGIELIIRALSLASFSMSIAFIIESQMLIFEVLFSKRQPLMTVKTMKWSSNLSGPLLT